MAHFLGILNRVTLLLLLSMAATVTVSAHEVEPAVGDVQIGSDRMDMTIRVALEPILAGVNLDLVTDTNASPFSDRNDSLRAMDPAALEAAVAEAWPSIAARMTLRAGDENLALELIDVTVPDIGNPDIRRDSVLTLSAALPANDAPVVFGWSADMGGLILRQVGGSYQVFLTGGALSDPMLRDGGGLQSLAPVVMRYIVSGFDHIIPKGLDHILFVLGLYFYSLAWRPLLWQVTAFTAAHTVTLALATTGVVSIPGDWMWLVETVIAGSIVYVAIENIWGGARKDIGPGRIGVVFAFGLLHGLGFASVLSEFGLGQNLVASLIAFNVGVEIGQLTVIAAAFLLLGAPFGAKAFYRRGIVIPGSAIIAAVGAYWVLNRIGLVGDIPLLT